MKPVVIDATHLKLGKYQEIYHLFKENGFELYLVGGTVRDYLLNIQLTDMDLVTNATPKDMKKFLPNADYTFEKFGSVKVNFQQIKFDITTLRKESGYIDNRHPSKVVFSSSLKEDVYRRDFTVNALYMDHNLEVIDYVNGQEDIKNKILRMVGNPIERIKEDPLRIVRAVRFSLDYNLQIEKSLLEALKSLKSLIYTLNQEKVKQEVSKCRNGEKLLDYLNELDNL